MKKIVMLVCACAFGMATFTGCWHPGEKVVSTPDKGTKPKLSPVSPDGTEMKITLD